MALTDAGNIIHSWLAGRLKVTGNLIPTQVTILRPGHFSSIIHAARAGVVIRQGKFPQVNISADLPGRTVGDIENDARGLLAGCHHAFGKNAHA